MRGSPQPNSSERAGGALPPDDARGAAAPGEAYDDSLLFLGSALRRRRREQGLSLRDLSKRCDLSISFLSLVERGRSSLALASLQRVANALETDVATLFREEGPGSAADAGARPHVQRGKEQHELAITSGRRTYMLLSNRSSDSILEPILVVIQPSESVDAPYGHEGEEFLYVLEGELTYIVEGVEHRLEHGDSIHLSSETPHTILNGGDAPAKAILVVTPRFF